VKHKAIFLLLLLGCTFAAGAQTHSRDAIPRLLTPQAYAAGSSFSPYAFTRLETETDGLLADITAEDLVVGFPNPNEIRVIGNDLDVDGNVLIVNNGTLRVEGARLRVRGNVRVFHAGTLEVLEGSLEFTPEYLYQYGITAANTAALWLRNSVLQCGGYNVGCALADTAALRFDGSSISGGVLTTTLGGWSRIDAAGSSNLGEMLFFDSTRGSFTDCDALLSWLTLPAASTLDASMPGARVLGSWHFPDSARQQNGFGYRVSYAGCTNLRWGLMLEAGCDATLRDSDFLAVGGLFRGSGATEVSGLVNNAIPRSYTYPAQDRDVQFENCSVQVWNLYALDAFRLGVRNSIIGEVLAMGNSDVLLQNAICDGTGGYAGTQDQATMLFAQSQITAPVIARDQSQLTLLLSSLQTHAPHAAGNGVVALFHSSFPGLPTVEAGAAAVIMGIDDRAAAPVESDVPLQGSVRFLAGDDLPIHFISFWFDAAREDNPGELLYVARPSIRERIRDTLGTWDTRGHVPGNHIVRLHMRISTDDTISIPAVIPLSAVNAAAALPAARNLHLSAWPNPVTRDAALQVRVRPAAPSARCSLTLTDMLGRTHMRRNMQGASTLALPLDALPAGTYLLRLTEDGRSATQRIHIIP
jgi:hypothetical protein